MSPSSYIVGLPKTLLRGLEELNSNEAEQEESSSQVLRQFQLKDQELLARLMQDRDPSTPGNRGGKIFLVVMICIGLGGKSYAG